MPKWEEIRDDLFEAVIQVQPPLSKDQQAEVERIMNERGHDMVWNAIRMPGRRTLQHWDADTHQAVLLALVEQMKPTGADWTGVVALLRGKGYGFSEGALTPYSTSTDMSNKQPTVWDHDAHLALLQATMAEAPPTPAQWDKILDRVAQKGYKYTASAAM
ncbi:hypothetical protein MFIFM68171_03264 [Madurella fahalii]|uniref:Uncharacterized protein n=1 Tax=Madurella fahalii TaxID=1157608 RepID=A0ABQ0G5L7_9PEZI